MFFHLSIEQLWRDYFKEINDIIKRFDIVKSLQSQNNANNGNSRSLQQKPTKGRHSKPEEKVKRDYFATQIAIELQDQKSLGCYRVIAEKVPQHIIFETIASVKETWNEGEITKSRGALFVDLIKNYCDKKHIDLQFSTP